MKKTLLPTTLLAAALLLAAPLLNAGDTPPLTKGSATFPDPKPLTKESAPVVTPSEKEKSPPQPFTATAGGTAAVIATVDLLFLGTVATILMSLMNGGKWSLAAALSEQITWLTPTAGRLPPLAANPPGRGGMVFPDPPKSSARGSTTSAPQVPFYESSMSRLIAFIGMLAIVFLFFGFGNWVLWHCLLNGRPPEGMDRIVWFLGAGASLFVPYALNQMRSATEEFSKLGRR